MKFSKFNKKKYFLFSLLFFIIALFASEEAITLPLLIVLYGFCFNKEMFKNIKNNIIKNYSAFFIAALLYVILRFFALGIRGRMEEYLAGSFYLTMLTMLKAYVYYIHLLIFPINLTLFHDIKIAGSFFNFNVLISFFILVIVLILTLKFYKNRILFFSVFWFFIALIPMSNILSLQVFMAERYLYVPSIGFSLLLSYFLFSIYNIKLKNLEQRKILRYGVVVFIILLLGFYALRTIDRNADFKNNLTLWSKTVKTSPNNSKAHNNLGFTYEHLGEGKKALEEFEIAVKLRPDNFKALTNLGAVYANLKRYNESVFVLEKAIEIRQYDRTYDKLGLVYVEIGDEENAIEQFNEAIKINPRYAKAHNDLGTVYGRIGEFDLALEEFNTAIKIDKDYADAYYNLGILLEFLDEEDEARKNFENALRLESDNELYIKKSGK